VAFPVNLGHGPGLDAGVLLRCRTEFFVALDVDAFPIADEWLDRLLTPLDHGAEVCGATSLHDDRQPYVHACCRAMRTSRFVRQRHTFKRGPTWDTAQRISELEWPSIHLLPLTSSHGPAMLGSVFGGVVYHNWYSARFGIHVGTSTLDGITPADAQLAWDDAMAASFPTEPEPGRPCSPANESRTRAVDPDAT
jgi:hypothetical protein